MHPLCSRWLKRDRDRAKSASAPKMTVDLQLVYLAHFSHEYALFWITRLAKPPSPLSRARRLGRHVACERAGASGFRLRKDIGTTLVKCQQHVDMSCHILLSWEPASAATWVRMTARPRIAARSKKRGVLNLDTTQVSFRCALQRWVARLIA